MFGPAPWWFAPACAAFSVLNAMVCIACYVGIRRLYRWRDQPRPQLESRDPCGKWPS